MNEQPAFTEHTTYGIEVNCDPVVMLNIDMQNKLVELSSRYDGDYETLLTFEVSEVKRLIMAFNRALDIIETAK